ncbi:hypothetical protein EYF80_010030 [Liparis tanakae]|uniref:Uncharacterized protein n=1 Tax=Liparis tanakae TaxID=230148 RepID=A0A4Z2IP62_9TELE|nr:hypothetical protein EYF80_010030 [Liparis tanakae]
MPELVLQLDLDLLVVSQRLLALSPERGGRATETGAEGQAGTDDRGQVVPVHTGLVGIHYTGNTHRNTRSPHRPVNEHDDEDDEGYDGRPDPNSNLSLQGEGGQAEVVVLNLTQGEVQIAHLDLKHTQKRLHTVLDMSHAQGNINIFPK